MRQRHAKLLAFCLFIMMAMGGGSAAFATVGCSDSGNPVGPATPTSPVSSCCKICTTGKACGDSCISSSYNCNAGSGCACNG